MEEISLFSGVGGFAIAAEKCGFKTIQFVENNQHKHKVLNRFYPQIPIHSDIRDYEFPSNFDGLITAGFPCTGTSIAGKRTGTAHPKSSLWRHIIRGSYQCSPKFIVVENPYGFTSRGLREYLGAMRMGGYQSKIICVSAVELGAGHRRGRIFVISHPHCGTGHGEIEDVSRSGEVRRLVQSVRSDSTWLKIKTGDDVSDNGLSVVLGRGDRQLKLQSSDLYCPKHLPGRINARIAMGQAVTPAQASIPLRYIQEYLLCTQQTDHT